jgi:hypothetical protein
VTRTVYRTILLIVICLWLRHSSFNLPLVTAIPFIVIVEYYMLDCSGGRLFPVFLNHVHGTNNIVTANVNWKEVTHYSSEFVWVVVETNPTSYGVQNLKV